MEIIDLINEGKFGEIFLNYGIDLIVSTLAILVFAFFIGRQIKKRMILSWLFMYLAVIFLAVLFNLRMLQAIVNVLVISLSVLFIILHEGEWRKIFVTDKKSRIIVEDDDKQFNQTLYKMMKDLVLSLSSSKTGAIITFEKHVNLDEYIKEGVPVKAPMSTALLSTIFYVGTTLHDGAVIVRDGVIEAASVFYLPTTRAMNGKFGARHRAALGISEVTDAVTIVVSEETGRISFTYQGELIPTSRDGFIADFSELMER